MRGRGRARLRMLSLGAVVLLASAVGAAGCSDDGPSGAPLGRDIPAPAPEKGGEPMTLVPVDPAPGQRFEVGFDPDNSRGGFFFLWWWDGESWGDPIYLLESDVNGGAPRVERIRDGIGMEDYGIEGPGPDSLVLPDDLVPGHWRLCTANALDEACAQFEIDG